MAYQSDSDSPAYVFVAGICHVPAIFDQLITEMRQNGVTSAVVDYPTVGSNTEGKTQQDEIAAIRESILHFLDSKQQDVVLVCHSYGGWPGSRAVKGLDKETRDRNGAKAGVVELVFIAAFIIPDNASADQYRRTASWLAKSGDMRTMTEEAKHYLMHDLEPDVQQHWFEQFQPHRLVLPDTCPDAPWHLSLPKTYIVTTDDPHEGIEFQLTWLRAVVNDTWSIKSIKAAHEVMLSKPAELAKLLLSPGY